jgi:hypothetical protein
MIVTSGTIIIKVGTKAKKYTLHEKLLTHYSGYFRGALSGNFKETHDGIITLNDIDTEAFDVFVDWLYEKQLPACLDTVSPRDGVRLKYRTYVLADRLLAPNMKSKLMDYVFEGLQSRKQRPSFQSTIYMFENLAETDPMLRFAVDAFSTRLGVYCLPSSSIKILPDLPKAYLVQVLLRVNHFSQNDRVLKREDYATDTQASKETTE